MQPLQNQAQEMQQNQTEMLLLPEETRGLRLF